jgi:hypothetical protein
MAYFIGISCGLMVALALVPSPAFTAALLYVIEDQLAADTIF